MSKQKEYQDRIISAIVKDLERPENRDLLKALVEFDSDGGEREHSFVGGFASAWNKTTGEQYRETPLSLEQARRFEAITQKQNDGWSGAIYAYMCRDLQAEVRKRHKHTKAKIYDKNVYFMTED